MLLDAGFDIAKWRLELLKDARGNAPVIAALGGKPTPAPAPTPLPAPGSVGVVRALLAAGVSPHVRTKNGNTALRNAIEEERADVVEMLLDAGVDPRKEPYNVRALASGNREIEAALRKKRPKR